MQASEQLKNVAGGDWLTDVLTFEAHGNLTLDDVAIDGEEALWLVNLANYGRHGAFQDAAKLVSDLTFELLLEGCGLANGAKGKEADARTLIEALLAPKRSGRWLRIAFLTPSRLPHASSSPYARMLFVKRASSSRVTTMSRPTCTLSTSFCRC